MYQKLLQVYSFLILCFAVLVNCNLSRAAKPITVARPNFIVVFCDNLGYGDIEPFGSKLHRTPNLNRMAAEGRKFTHFCVTAGVCTPSRASLMTGCYAQRVGMHKNERDGWVLRPVSPFGLSPEEVTIAEVLKKQGYATGIVGKWHLGDQPEFLPTRQGFDWFFGVPYSDDMTARTWDKDGSQWPPLPLMQNETVIEAPCDRNGLTKRYTEHAVQWIQEHKDEPFFLYFPQAMPGSTRTPFASAEFKGKSQNGPWGDAIEELDWSIGVLLDQLNELGIAERTLVIWTSDNGAPVNANRSDLSRGSNLPLHGRGYTTAEGAFRVPTIAWQPGKVPKGSECAEFATTMDLLPTFAKLSGGDLPRRRIDGHDVSDLLFSESAAKSPYEAFYYYDQDQLQAVRSGPWKLFLPVKPSGRHPHFGEKLSPRPLLFNVENDIGSKHNVASKHPEIVSRLTALADEGRRELGDVGLVGSGQRKTGRIPVGRDPQPQVQQTNALKVIEGTRGGRHWANDQTATPKTPADSLAAIEIESGYEIELVASEPLVRDPVAITFDEEGRMFVVEYGDYPMGPPEGEPPLSKIVMLNDKDGNGQFDERVVFADGLDFAHSLMPYRGGMLVGAKTKLMFLKDLDEDGVADERKTLFDGFVPAHPQMQIGNPRWGIDNWVYCNYGPGKVQVAGVPGKPVSLPRKDFRFDPLTMDFGADSGMGQFGNTIDRWGRRFYCTNRNPIITTFLTPAELARNPYHIVTRPSYDVGKAGAETQVFPLVAMKSNYLSHAGTHTSACGTTAYIGQLGDAGFRDSIFVCEPIGHLVTRSIVKPLGVRLTVERARERKDFIASTDTWFRPSSMATGPDGSLYLADMYRLWVEHPKFLPSEIAAKLDWRAGEDRGRIYRIRPKGSKPMPFAPANSIVEKVALLASKNGWQQFLGQRLLVESQSTEAVDAVRRLLNQADTSATCRLHALWTLRGLGALSAEDLIGSVDSESVELRTTVARLGRELLDEPRVLRMVLGLVGDSSARVRMEVALSLSANKSAEATQSLSQLAIRDGFDSHCSDALLTSLKDRAGEVLDAVVTSLEGMQVSQQQQESGLLHRLASIIGSRGDLDELDAAMSLLGNARSDDFWWRAAIVAGLGEGLPRYRGSLGRLSLQTLYANPPTELAHAVEMLKTCFELSQRIATDPAYELPSRLAAIELLGFQPFAETKPTLSRLIDIDQPVSIQSAAIKSLLRTGSSEAVEVVLRRWRELGSAVRSPTVTALMQKKTWMRKMLSAMEAGEMQRSVLNTDQRVRLLKHSDPEIRRSAERLLGGAVSTDRLSVAKEYEKALALLGDAKSGKNVFQRACAACHRVDEIGFRAGPDLNDLRNRSKAAILYDILDPNSQVEPRFTAYSILTADDSVFTGLITSESAEAIVLQMAEGKQKTIGRAEIETIKVSEVSLMPEGIEKDISVPQMADLLEFLKRS